MEITTLFVDEAHNYKNVPIRTRMKYLRGINISGSKKCLDMLQKVRYVQNSDFGKGVVFATGTPLCNSLADAYTLQMYLQYDDMRKRHFDVFDNWVKTFTKPEKVVEVDVCVALTTRRDFIELILPRTNNFGKYGFRLWFDTRIDNDCCFNRSHVFIKI